MEATIPTIPKESLHMDTTHTFTRGRDFIYRQGRLLDQRLFETLFEGAPPEGVLDALRGYRNLDGGFGHGLEPDVRCPASQPLDVEVALQTMDAAGAIDEEMVQAAVHFLAEASSPEGGVPVVLPSIAAYPHAEHWGDGVFPPGLNPTAGIAGLLFKFGIQHPWLDRAAAFCRQELERELPGDAHTLIEALTFLEYAPDLAERLIPAVTQQLPRAALYLGNADDEGYGLTPLQFAPTPESHWRSLFTDDQIEAHLDRLQGEQQADGGWPVIWEPPSEASTLEWRGRLTLLALQTLAAYGRS
jgi:hypothetical protein